LSLFGFLLAVVTGGLACSHAPLTDSPGAPSADAAGAAGNSGLSGYAPVDDPSIPTKGGVPVGDCTEPTAEQLTALGCPVSEPAFQSSCDAPASALCRYSITVTPGFSSQLVYGCEQQLGSTTTTTAWTAVRTTCGESCRATATNIIDVSGATCAERSVVSCLAQLSNMGDFFAASPTKQELLNSELSLLVSTCAGGVNDNEVEVHLEGGCPVQISSEKPFSPEVVACFKTRLETLRWDCAEDLVCGRFDHVLLP
jgi:hypothetical protein